MDSIFIKAYFNCNLGDDLFVYTFLKRYSKQHFRFIAPCCYNSILPFDNYKLYSKEKNNFFDKFIKLFSFKTTSLENILMKKSRFTVLIGGSMFIEKKGNKHKYFIGNGKPYYMLGINFGPYFSNNYIEKFRKIFQGAEDVCFREKYSFNLFEEIERVRVAPDILLGLDTKKLSFNVDEKSVVFSVVDCDKKADSKYKKKYESMIIELIKYFDKLDYKVILMSFCKNEGDENAIKSIIEKIDDINIITYNYNGNIEESLNILSCSSFIVGSRFHANILGLAMNKPILPIAYSDKLLNSLKDINYDGKIIDIRNIESFNVNDLSIEDLTYHYNVEKYKLESEKHFEKLDQILERN